MVLFQSTNGTFLNGEKLGSSKREKLTNGSKITFGLDYSYTFELKPIVNNHLEADDSVILVQDELVPPDIEEIIDNYENNISASNPNESCNTGLIAAPEPPLLENKAVGIEKEIQPKQEKQKKEVEETSENNEETKSAKKRKFNEKVEEEMQCSICTEPFVKATTLNCTHTFCNYCILQWRKMHNKCPICRVPITNLLHTLVLDNVVNNMVELQSEEEKEFRKKLLAERELQMKNEKKKKKTSRTDLIDLTHEDQSSSSEFDWDSTSTSDNDFLNYDDESHDSDDSPRRRVVRYGGYGRCYVCGDPTHWAPSCPRRGG